MEEFSKQQNRMPKSNTNLAIDTDCWFNHKDLGMLLDDWKSSEPLNSIRVNYGN